MKTEEVRYEIEGKLSGSLWRICGIWYLQSDAEAGLKQWCEFRPECSFRIIKVTTITTRETTRELLPPSH